MTAAEDTPTPPRVSVVIPAFRRGPSVRRALQALFEQDLPAQEYEVIVVDGTPGDEVAAVVRELQPLAPCALRYYSKPPEGPGPSRNLGVQQARGEIIAFTDSDCLPTPGWLRGGLAAFADGIGLVQGQVLPDPGVPAGILTYYPTVLNETALYECANMFYRRAAIQAVGGFHGDYTSGADDYALGGEDVDLAWRVKRSGWRSRFTGEALVYHEVRPIALVRWFWIRPLATWPLLVKRFPELRESVFARYFLDRHQAALTLALLGLALTALSPLALLLCLPYLASRPAEGGRRLRGPLRPLRAIVYLPRDLVSFLILLTASIRHRSLLL